MKNPKNSFTFLDPEWVQLMGEAKKLGLTVSDIRSYFDYHKNESAKGELK
ncbi:anti-repressor SinI family protein [Sediminibacillus massiliensis]|nr:anti-repressor SinI family protein [Sediminibacillus massiliensis]